jgi:hypothetical protein
MPTPGKPRPGKPVPGKKVDARAFARAQNNRARSYVGAPLASARLTTCAARCQRKLRTGRPAVAHARCLALWPTHEPFQTGGRRLDCVRQTNDKLAQPARRPACGLGT